MGPNRVSRTSLSGLLLAPGTTSWPSLCAWTCCQAPVSLQGSASDAAEGQPSTAQHSTICQHARRSGTALGRSTLAMQMRCPRRPCYRTSRRHRDGRCRNWSSRYRLTFVFPRPMRSSQEMRQHVLPPNRCPFPGLRTSCSRLSRVFALAHPRLSFPLSFEVHRRQLHPASSEAGTKSTHHESLSPWTDPKGIAPQGRLRRWYR